MSELELQEAILRHALDLQRLSANDEAAVLEALKQLEAELRTLLARGGLTDGSKRTLEALIKEAGEAIDGAYDKAKSVVDTQRLALIVGQHTQEILAEVIPATIAAPTAETLSALTRDVLIQGSPASAWWNRQAESLAFKFAGRVRQGVRNGETIDVITARVVGRRGEPGILNVARRDARALVHSSIMAVANEARQATYRRNSRYLAGVRWLATLDGHTCPRCAALDGQAWDLEGDRMKGTRVDFIAPPIHMNDRCVLSPIPKSLDELGFEGVDEAIAAASRRASAEGPVHGAMTFGQFFARRTPAQQDAQFGPERAKLFRDGKITIRDLISGTGRPLTLDELQAR